MERLLKLQGKWRLLGMNQGPKLPGDQHRADQRNQEGHQPEQCVDGSVKSIRLAGELPVAQRRGELRGASAMADSQSLTEFDQELSDSPPAGIPTGLRQRGQSMAFPGVSGPTRPPHCGHTIPFMKNASILEGQPSASSVPREAAIDQHRRGRRLPDRLPGVFWGGAFSSRRGVRGQPGE